MRSVRLDAELDRRVRRAAEIRDESVFEFLRRAAAKTADETLAAPLMEQWTDVIGVADGADRRELFRIISSP
jgi:hypothetical protein